VVDWSIAHDILVFRCAKRLAFRRPREICYPDSAELAIAQAARAEAQAAMRQQQLNASAAELNCKDSLIDNKR
jgi:hypothetical protein